MPSLVQIMADRHQPIICTNVGILFIGPLGTNFNEVLVEMQQFSFKKMHLINVVCQVSSILSQPQYVNQVIVILNWLCEGKINFSQILIFRICAKLLKEHFIRYFT